ncbi:MAG: diguanylate cyclase, partial [Acidimicrobiaceae bacterium]
MDLTATARTLVSLNPRLTNAELEEWSSRVGADARYQESLGFEFIARVPDAHLADYEASVAADPIAGAEPFKAAGMLPPGPRDHYCLTQAVHLQGSAVALLQTSPQSLAEMDWCATPLGSGLDSATDTGQFAVSSAPDLVRGAASTVAAALHVDLSTDTLRWVDAMNRSVLVFAPIYRDGVTPPTVLERRDALVGWVSAGFDAGVVLDRAIVDRAGLQVTLSRGGASGTANIVSGTAKGEFSTTKVVDADGQWSISVVGQVDPAAATPTTQARIALAAGVALSLLLFGVVRILASSRSRALDLVDRKTGELHHQALHDALTGLPNRLLIIDRASQMLARAHREQSEVALVFI